MKKIYIIEIQNSKKQMQRYHIGADTRESAEAKACELAGVPAGTEPSCCMSRDNLDAVV
jgi:hypothetical protein